MKIKGFGTPGQLLTPPGPLWLKTSSGFLPDFFRILPDFFTCALPATRVQGLAGFNGSYAADLGPAE